VRPPEGRHRTVHLLTACLAGIAAVALVAVAPPARAGEETGAAVTTEYGRMILVLDSSGSMAEPAGGGRTKMQAAKGALDTVVDHLPDPAYVGLRVYGATVFSKGRPGACADSQLVVPPGTDNRAELRRAIARFRPYGETPIAYALRQAGRDIGGEGKRSIVLVSDGEATCAPDPCVVARRLSSAGIDLQIDVVGLSVSGRARDQLQCIADRGNGTYYDAQSADQIADSITRVATRGVRPFTLDGEPVRGSADPSAPTPVAEGVWTDTLPAAAPESDVDARYYSHTRTMPGSTVHVSVTSTGAPGEWDRVDSQLSTPGGTVCDTANDLRTVDSTSVLGAESLSHEAGAETSECATAESLLLQVSHIAPEAGAAVGLIVVEEPPVRGSVTPPTVPGDDTGSALPPIGPGGPEVLGGTSFPDATEVTTGSYSGTTVPGETQMFRVPLDWGQRLAVRFTFPRSAPAIRAKTGVQGPFATIKTYSPMRAALSDDVGRSRVTGFSSGWSQDTIYDETLPVAYRNRSISSARSSLPGDYYVALAVNKDSDGETYELPYTMDVRVVGEPVAGPDYVYDGTWSPFASIQAARAETAQSTSSEGTPTESPVATAPASASTQTADEPHTGEGSGLGSGQVLVAGTLGVVAAACAALAVLLLRRRRT
jgi:Ca-activated chloride channel family protein